VRPADPLKKERRNCCVKKCLQNKQSTRNLIYGTYILGGNMKICITSEGKELTSNLDPRFGRAAYFIFYDTETDEFEALANDNTTGMGGVGIQSGQLMAEKGVELVLTGNLGPNAAGVLEQAGIKAITGVSGKIEEVIENYKKGNLKEKAGPTNPSVTSKFGMDKKDK